MQEETRHTPSWRWLPVVAGPLVALLLELLAQPAAQDAPMLRVAGIALWMSIWWVSEAVPLAITALLPFVCFPLLGILPSEQVAGEYFNSTVFLFLGGFMLALAIERWQLHRRIALAVLSLFGAQPSRLVLGFLVATGFLSMWMSNTAVALLMMPVALAVIARLEASGGPQPRLGAALVLAVAYAASIGGIGTPLGSPPNLVFMRQYSLSFPDAAPVSFAQWTLFCVPLMLLMLLLAWALLQWRFLRAGTLLAGSAQLLREERASLGPPGREEWAVGAVFVLTALLWLTRAPLALGTLNVPGWGSLFPGPGGVSLADDGTVAVLATLALFLIPARRTVGGGALLRWEDAQRLPWGFVLLFGGGFALAEGVVSSGLSAWCGERLGVVAGLPPFILVLAVYLFTSLFGELASNTAIAQVVLPIAAGISIVGGVHPLLLMLPVALASSLDFILPTATPPNAIALATGRVDIRQLVSTGLIVEFACAGIVVLGMWLLGHSLLGV
jgi:sodium-dependent dicarboxylate transporter 2/3/5